jgi:hypothetical protein
MFGNCSTVPYPSSHHVTSPSMIRVFFHPFVLPSVWSHSGSKKWECLSNLRQSLPPVNLPTLCRISSSCSLQLGWASPWFIDPCHRSCSPCSSSLIRHFILSPFPLSPVPHHLGSSHTPLFSRGPSATFFFNSFKCRSLYLTPTNLTKSCDCMWFTSRFKTSINKLPYVKDKSKTYVTWRIEILSMKSHKRNSGRPHPFTFCNHV